MKRVKKPRKSRAKVKFKTKAYVGNPGKKAEIKIDSLQNKVDSLQKENEKLKIKLTIK